MRVRTWFALTAALAMVACTPGGVASPVSVPPPPAATGVPNTGPITLTVWDQESGPPSKVWDQLNAEFEAKYPNVTIVRVNRDFGELKTLLKLSISGPHAPDVVEANQGWPDMGALVKAGLLVPLDNYAKAYGWDKKVSANVRAVSTWSPDGKEFGTGNLFGYTTMGEIVGVYYNKTIMGRLGIARTPVTFEEFEHDLATAKAAGVTPIQFGNTDGFPGIHEYATIQDQMAQTSYLTDLILGRERNNLSFDTPGNVQAATSLQDWARQGYFTSGFGGGGYDNSVANFAAGQGLFMITGNWIVGDLGADNTDYGFFPLPPMTAGGPEVSTGGAGFPLAITAGSQHPDAAAAYIDFMNSDHAAELLMKAGQIPLASGVAESSVEPGTVLADVVHTASAVSKENGIVPYEDWATPTFYDTLSAGVQELMAMRVTPQQFVSDAQKDYSDFQGSRA